MAIAFLLAQPDIKVLAITVGCNGWSQQWAGVMSIIRLTKCFVQTFPWHSHPCTTPTHTTESAGCYLALAKKVCLAQHKERWSLDLIHGTSGWGSRCMIASMSFKGMVCISSLPIMASWQSAKIYCEDGKQDSKKESKETQGGQEGAEQGREGRRRARRIARMEARKLNEPNGLPDPTLLTGKGNSLSEFSVYPSTSDHLVGRTLAN